MIRSAFIVATLTAFPAMALAQAPAPAEERAPTAAPVAAAKLKL
ncbi:MAG: DinB family protein, partial [Hyphomicrobiales bacterium]